ncbi:MAG: Tc toxin subunit A, partial [Anaerolineae bacterium]|nr:Tc toxin subunit A [Anaerolineae bacterium]
CYAFGGTAIRIGETITDEKGDYTLTYKLRNPAARLEVRAVDAEGKEIALSKPLNQRIDKSPNKLNLIAPGTLQPLAAEYLRLTNDLKPHVGEMRNLANVKEDAKIQDLTVLNRTTGWDARLIALAATTERLSADADVKLPQEAIYGLLRAGLPSDKLMLAQVSADVAEQALKTVRDAGIVELTDQQIGQFKQQFATFSNKVRLAVPAPGSRSTYGELLKASRLSDDAQAKFAAVYLSHRGDAAQLWENARQAGLDDMQIGKLQLQGKLAFLAGNSEWMTARLMQKQINDPVQLVEQDSHRADAWVNEVYDLAGIPVNLRDNLTDAHKKKLDAVIPAAYAGDKVEDRLDAYAEDMARKVRLSYPTQVVGRMIEQDNTDAFKLGAARAGTATLLKSAAGQGFRLGQTPVAAFLKTHVGVAAGMADNEFQAAQQQMKTLQRVYQITPSNAAMPVLMSLGMSSAYDVMAYSEEAFAELYNAKYQELYGKVSTQAEARLVRRKAEQVSSVTYNLFTIAKKLDSEAPVYGIAASAEVRESVRNELIKQFPTMESLFGSMDFCECEHCRSVLSPAAYLVDLLQFVDPAPEEGWDGFLALWKKNHGGHAYTGEYTLNGQQFTGKYKKPYDALVERRPDLPHIPLTCENTHTALPYIDIVNEILEYYVANEELTEDAAHDTGEATTAELLAEPQNVIREAYDKLREARYPLNLPFDLWIETVRQFCNYFETPLARVLEVFRPSDDLFAATQPFDHSSIFIESLGLSLAETAIFTDPDPLGNDKWHELYGYPRVRPAIQNPTNAEHATLTIANADAEKFRKGIACTYFDVSANVLNAETKTISAVGAPDSGGAGLTIITLRGVWNAPPDAGDHLVCDALATLKSAKALSRRLSVTYKEIVEIVQTGFVNPKLNELIILYKLGVT